MFSTLSERGAEATLEALSLGATDYVTKPSNMDMGSTSASITAELIPKIRALCHLPTVPRTPHSGASLPASKELQTAIRTRSAPFRPARINIVTIGVSTGGPDALGILLPSIPAKFPLPIVVAQHMPAFFTAMLAKRLAEKCAVPVRECVSGDVLEPGCIWIAPGDYHMVVQREENRVVLRTNQGPRENFCRPAVDVLFRSVAKAYGINSLGVILTGMGQDGLKGCEALCATGASVIIQDEASSVVWGMPGFVARAGLAERILPLNQIASEINRRVAAQFPLQVAHQI
jgi:two-component system, chemotaxis family, protein-glutamate methylesterase/glutaminase